MTEHQEVRTAAPARESPPPQSVLPVSRALAVLLGTAAVVVIAAAFKAAADIVAPVILALVLSIAVLPVRRWAKGRGWPGWASTGLMMVTAYGIVLLLVVGLALSVVKLATTLPQYAGRADDVTSSVEAWLADLDVDTEPVDAALRQLDLGKVTGLLTDILTDLLGVLSSLFFLVTLLFFMSVDAAGVATRRAALAVWKPELSEALNGFVHVTRRYLLITALFGAIVAVLDAGALWLLGVPLPLIWGLLSFITNFVPNIGFVIGLIPPALLALLDQGWEQMLAVIATYCVLNLVIQTFIQPRVVGDAVGLGTTVTFLSLVLWTFLLGSLGALLAVPMTLLVRAVLIDADPAARWSLLFVGSDETTRRLAEPATRR
ncbi:MAG: AI-2E family transporter [Actinomycetes bacterium]